MPGPTGPSPKMLGLLAALALAMIFVAILWLARTTSVTVQPTNNDLFPDDPSEIPGFNDLASSDGMTVTMTDKLDPTRIASTLAADRFEPIGGGRRRLDHPVAWIYQRDGRAIQIKADTGTVMMPDPNQPPESGTLSGNVSVRSFASTPAPGTPPADNAEPTMVTSFDAPVEFERQYLRLRSIGHFTIQSEQIDFAGEDLTIMLNEVRDRIELIDIRRGDQLVIRPNAKRTKSTTPAPIASTPQQTTTPPSASPAEQSAQPAPPASEPPAITRYHVRFADSVLARVIGTGSITTDSLDIWALLEDGQLRDNAIAQIAMASTSDQPKPKSEPEPKPEINPSTNQSTLPTGQGPVAPPADPTTTPEPAHNPGELVITWSGPLTVNPLADNDNPTQLASNDLTVEFNADPGNTVRFDAPQRGLTGTADHAAYHATTGVLALNTNEQSPTPTEIIIDNAGSIRTNHIEASFLTGTIAIQSPGIISTTPADAPGAELTWKDNASFQIAQAPDGSLTNRLQRASFVGTVQGQQDGNQVAGARITAGFDPSSPPASALRKLSFINGVLINKDNASLGGNLLDIEFAPGSMGHDIDPIRVAASDSVFGRTDGEVLRAERLNITLARDLSGRVFARTANAHDNVRYTGKNRTNAKADSLIADGVTEQLNLVGTPSAYASVTQAGSTITGQQIDLNARSRSLGVDGPGTFDHDVTLADPTSADGHIRVSWRGSMRFDDALGSILCEDTVTVISTPDAYTKDKLSAHRVEIDLSPMPIAEPIDGQPLPDRELLAARAYGHIPQGTGQDAEPVPAKIESRTYATNDPERAIGLLYLQGPQLIADNRRQTLTIPAPGMLLVMDRTDASTGDAGFTSSGGPGLTRFTWQGRMQLDRAAGNAAMHDRVAVHHKSLTDGQTMTLDCDTLDAAFELASQSGGTNRLNSANATGSVNFSSQTRQLLADSARFDALGESIFATGENGNLVTLYDAAQPAPVSARTLLWDLARDRIEINALTPVRAPSAP